MATETQPIETSALLVIDVQESFRADEARWARRGNPGFEGNLTRLIDAYRQAERPVIWVVHEDADEHFLPGSPYLALQPFLHRRQDEPLLHKRTRNAFTSTDLAERLAALGVRRIAITGIQTEQCCETTARVAGDLGYDVDFVTEATLTFPITDPATGDVQPADAITRATEFSLRGRFARIASVSALAAELETLAACSA
ncbi:MAG TPA: cysteine hydrolase family protein [Longimicrobium sp.]|jgi:nicotinamidase-related amidase|uniref:cysteine hydrolase family protein n=1 Tax=Longimicrobium sp. TaxID=2029185 RepID=UPI002EDA0714